MATIEIRTATDADDRALAQLDATAWPRELWVVPPQPASAPFFGPRRQPEDVLVAVGEGGTIVGYGRLGRHLPVASNAHVLHLDALAVAPEGRGQGVGTALIDALIAEARARGARKLGLRALSTNHGAISLYERAGFELEGRLRDEIKLPDGSYADDVWYALTL